MKTSLGLVLALCLAGLQFIAVVIVVTLSYLGSERVLLDHARNLMSDVGTNTIAHSQGFLDPARSAAELAARLAENRIIASENQQKLEQLLFQQLQLAPQFAGVYYGDQDGNFVYVMRSDGPGPYRSKIISNTGPVRSTKLIWRTDDFAVVKQSDDPADVFDPRERPWYIEAQRESKTVWTDPYIFFTSQSPGITIATPVLRDGDNLQGVIGVDIKISAISDFLSQLKIGESGAALIMNSNGDVIAHPRSELLKAVNADGTFRFAGIDEIEDPIARRAFANLSKMDFVSVAAETHTEFSYDGANFVSTIMPIMSEELPWTIAVYAPENDFIGAILRNRNRDIWVAALVAVMTGVVGLSLANFINKPVRAFAVRSALISQGEIDPSEPIPRTYRELEQANQTLTQEILQRKKSEREYGQTFNLSSRGMVQIDPETGRLLRANQKFADIFGYTLDEVSTMSTDALCQTGEPMIISELVKGEADGGGSSAEKRCRRKDGKEIWVKVNAIMIHDHKGRPLHLVATIDDITKNKISEVQISKLNRDLSHLARGEVLGQMAAGLAHELNQPLTAITQNADAAVQTAREQQCETQELVQILEELDQQAHRAAEIIKALRGFARKGEEWKTPFDLPELVRQSLLLVQAEATEHGVEMSFVADDLPQVVGIRVQIAQVLVNLLRNAIEAISASGSNTKNVVVEARNIPGFVEVRVRDTGPGIDPEIDLFTQFETTKGDGMGLGLSICRSIVEAGGGKMRHEPGAGHGAQFIFTIPAAT